MPLAAVVTVACGAVLAYAQWSVITPPTVLYWFVTLMVVVVARTLLAVAYHRRSKLTAHTPAIWGRLFLIGSTLSGLVWGWSAVALFPSAEPASQVPTTIVVAGVAAGSVTSLAASWLASSIFVTVSVIPLSFSMMTSGSEVALLVGALTLVFYAAVMLNGHRIQSNIVQNFRLSFDAAARSREQALNQVTRGTSGEVGRAFFRELVATLSDGMHTDLAIVGFFEPGSQRFNPLATRFQARFLEPSSFRMDDATFRDLFGERIRVCARGASVSTRVLGVDATMMADSYATVALLDAERNPLGLVAIFNERPIEDPEDLRSLLSIFADRAQAELQRLRAERDMLEAKEKAEEASVAKSAFLANMSHEIRTPLHGVLGLTEILRNTGATSEQQGYLDLIQKSGETQLAIIDDVLDFSSIESGKLALDVHDFEIRSALMDAIEPLAVEAHVKGLELITVFAAQVPERARGDAMRLRQVLSNLVRNAVKFTDRGQVSVEVDGERGPDGVTRLRIVVEDTGVGISTEAQARIFEAFEQGDNSLTRRFGGTGLGLTLCHRLVQLMSGTIRLDSEPGRGSRFSLELPLQQCSEVVDPSTQRSPCLAAARILVLDDRQQSLTGIEAMLTPLCERVTTATSGEAAVLELRRAFERGVLPDVAIVDTDMPHVDGPEFVHQLRRDPALCGIPVILLVALGDAQQLKRARQVSDARCVTKPVRAHALERCLVEVLTSTPRAHDVPEAAVAAPGPEATRAAAHEDDSARRSRVLVVDDNVINRKVAVMLVEAAGYAADVAVNGREAVDAQGATSYAAVLMDCQMPVMDGFEATELIRQNEAEGCRIPIVAMTAHALQRDREHALRSGMDDFLTKPVTKDVLKDTLDRWIQSDANEAAAASKREVQPDDRGPQH
ncbi:MAG: hypothetical protein DHS20C15_11830 [Planctomycetota bacterium]|nr:MAG: hypothetical protein DHS20C15_11830 [Planctomycetota bacterium]